mmetsp:Transcript_14515/g.42863  ORF Transcript_14515/g.42863 Transcript_14515/m.42863 type:complete len:296 (+) Transcript_14515:703-1590(+)
MLDAWNVQRSRRHAGGQDNTVEPREVIHSNLRAKSHGHVGRIETLLEVADGFVELLLAWDLLGHVELPTDLVRLVEERDLMATVAGRGRRREARRSCPDDGDLDALLRSDGGDLELGLVASDGVHQARGGHHLECVVEARLVASDARVDFVLTAILCLVDNVGVREKGPGHGDEVRLALHQDVFSDLRRVDAVGCAEWGCEARFGLEFFRHPGKGSTRHGRGDGWNAGLVPANARVNDVHSGRFELLGKGHHFTPLGSALHKVEHGKAEDDDEVVIHRFAYLPHSLQSELDPVLV